MELRIIKLITLVADLLSLSMAVGLIFAVLVQTRRNVSAYFFAGFCSAMAFWSVTSLIINLPLTWTIDNAVLALSIRLTAAALMVLAFFLFVVAFLNPAGTAIRILTAAAPLVFVFAMGVVWTNQTFILAEGVPQFYAIADVAIAPLGWLTLGIAIAYLVTAFWIILSSGATHARLLLVPSILLIAAYITNVVEPLRETALDTLLITASAIWVGWAVLRHEVFNPLNDLNDELRITNRDLQQVITDLAGEKARAEALNTQLRAANQYKTEFLANMSHELRTPLNSIIGYSELLRNGIYGALNEKQSDRLEKIHRNGAQLLDLISDILDLNKIEAGKLRLESEAFDVAQVIEQVVGDHQEDADAKGLKLETTILNDPLTLYGDQKRVRQMLENILDNAVKFTHQGAVRLEARALTVERGKSSQFPLPAIGWLRDGAWVLFSISDTGIGIAPENQARIFEEFAQVDGSHTREFGGTGLGLAITKKLVTMHDGVIWVRSRLEEGSTFYIALPSDVKEKSEAAADLQAGA